MVRFMALQIQKSESRNSDTMFRKTKDENTVVTYQLSFYVVDGKLDELSLRDPKEIELVEYNKNNFTKFNEAVNKVREAITSGGVIFEYIDDHIRYGSGGFYLVNTKEGCFLLLAQRTPDAPRMANFLDGSFGIGSYYVPTHNAIAEIGEEISLLRVPSDNDSGAIFKTADQKPFLLIPHFDKDVPEHDSINRIIKTNAIKAFNTLKQGEFKIAEVRAEIFPLKNSSRILINGNQSSHKANVSFEKASVELAMGVVCLDMRELSIRDLILHDTERSERGLHRRNVCIDMSNGNAIIYQDGKIIEETPFADYIKRIRNEEGEYSTGKVKALQENWPDQLDRYNWDRILRR